MGLKEQRDQRYVGSRHRQGGGIHQRHPLNEAG
jgi:hypothetical protein